MIEYSVKVSIAADCEVECSRCGRQQMQAYTYIGSDTVNPKTRFANRLRELGWKEIGMDLLCPGCVKESKGE